MGKKVAGQLPVEQVAGQADHAKDEQDGDDCDEDVGHQQAIAQPPEHPAPPEAHPAQGQREPQDDEQQAENYLQGGLTRQPSEDPPEQRNPGAPTHTETRTPPGKLWKGHRKPAASPAEPEERWQKVRPVSITATA